MRDRTLVWLLVLPLIVAAGFAGFRLATRRKPVPPGDTSESLLRTAAEKSAELRLGRKLDETEKAMIHIERRPDGGWIARYDEPLHSRIPSTLPSSGPATRP